MKKLISVLLFATIIFNFNIYSFAAEPVSVKADDVALLQNQEISIPVKIENNSGIMGFKITVEYPVDKIDVKSVSRGDITSEGNFNTNFGINDGKFDVLWNNVEEIKNDGTLFLIVVEPASTSNFNSEIKLTYSQPDTFNEEYEDVKFDCRNIAVNFSLNENQNESEETTIPITDEKQDTVAYDNNHILSAVKDSFEEYGYKALSEIKSDNQQYFLATVNQKLSELSNGKYATINSFENLVSLYNSAYEGIFITNVTSEIPNENIQQAIKDALKTVGADSISELKEDENEEFVKELEKNLKNYNSSIPSISENVDVDKALDIAEKLDDTTKPTHSQQDLAESNNTNNTWIVVLVSVLCVAVIVAVMIVALKKRRRKNEK